MCLIKLDLSDGSDRHVSPRATVAFHVCFDFSVCVCLFR